MTEIDLGKYTIEEVRAFWDQMVRRNPPEREYTGEQHVIFRLGMHYFAVKAIHCGGVVGFRTPSPLPVLPQHILGVAAVRGRPVSVTDLAVLLGNKATPKGGHLLILRAEGEETALKVDWVDSVVDIDTSNLEPPSAKWQGFRTGLVVGMVKHKHHTVVVIDAARCIKAADSI